jgi:hypothetical protein
MSAGKPWSRKRNNVRNRALGFFPLLDDGLPLGASAQENRNRHLEGEISDADENVFAVIGNSVIGDTPHPQRQPHTQLPESATRTRAETGITLVKVNGDFPLNLRCLSVGRISA